MVSKLWRLFFAIALVLALSWIFAGLGVSFAQTSQPAAPTITTTSSCAGISSPTIGTSWCWDTSSPIMPVMRVWDGVNWTPFAGLLKGANPPTTALNNALWVNTNSQPPILEECNGSGQASNQCVSQGENAGGSWIPLVMVNLNAPDYVGFLTVNNAVQQTNNTLVYGTTVTPNLAAGPVQEVAITNATAFTLANPATVPVGLSWRMVFYNSSAALSGAVTLGTDYHVDASFVSGTTTVAAGKRLSCRFYNESATVIELEAPCTAAE